MRYLSVLGSTGSIGTQTLQVVREREGEFIIKALAAGSNTRLMEEQAREFKPEFIAMKDEESAGDLKIRLKDLDIEIGYGMEGLVRAASYEGSDMVLTAVVGMMGIKPAIAALESGKILALANKETLVTAGHIIMPLAKKTGKPILPVDSEHSAIFQSLRSGTHSEIEKILLTASGGPFRGRSYNELLDVKPADALKHPNWSMGQKITIDSATMVNKGLEIIEAKWLFDVEADNIEVLVHPQSILHSAVMFKDGSIIGQMGLPDMKLPIQYAICEESRPASTGAFADLTAIGKLEFQKPDQEVFKAIPLAYKAIGTGGSMPTVYNAANEEAVAAFLKGETTFVSIWEMIEEAMSLHSVKKNPSLSEIFETEQYAREFIRRKIGK